MTLHGMLIMLLLFGLVGFVGGGVALAIARHRTRSEGDRDPGLMGIAVMFLFFGALCVVAASGMVGVLAFGGVVASASYLYTAQRLGVFRIETAHTPPLEREPSEHRTP